MSNNIKNLCYLINNQGEVLLQFKRRGFGVGKWNGPGGKVETGEELEQAVIREVKEETGLEASDLKKMAELEFYFHDRQDWDNITHVYVAGSYAGEMQANNEGELKWFKINELPFERMWDDDPHWLPRVLAGEFMKMKFYFDSQGKLLRFEHT